MKLHIPHILTLLLLLTVSACQEIKITVEMPDGYDRPSETRSPSDKLYLAGTPILTSTEPLPSLTVETLSAITQTPTPTQDPVFNPDNCLLGWPDLPQEYYFTGGHLKMFNVSYLYSPGNLAGIAYVREIFAYQDDVLLTEIIIHSPVPISSEMLRAGFYGDTIGSVDEEWRLGDMTLAGSRQDERFTQAYRFSQGNIMVVLALQGENPYVSFESVYLLAQQIHQRLPKEIVVSPQFPEMSSDVNFADFQRYFNYIELVECQGDHPVVDTFVNGDSGYCFRADIIDLVPNLKVGIYNPRYGKLLYLKEFQSFTQLGEWTNGLFHPVWDFGWQHLQGSEYEARFWIEDQMVASIPFHYSPAGQ